MMTPHPQSIPTVLVLDADHGLRGLLTQFLASHGFTVCSIANTADQEPALQMLRKPASGSPRLHVAGYQFDPQQDLLYTADGESRKLSHTESRLLQFFYQNAGTVLTRDAISFHLYGVEANPLDRRVDMQVQRLRRKLEPDTKAEDARYLRTVWRQGYRLNR